MPLTERDFTSRQNESRESFMDRSQRRRRQVRARDVLRAIRKAEQTLADAGTPTSPPHDALVTIKDYKTSRVGPKVKEPPAS
jgi:hypothetical protein